MCGPHGTKFLKAVELRLPHSASMTPEGWSFALNSSNNSGWYSLGAWPRRGERTGSDTNFVILPKLKRNWDGKNGLV